MAQFAPGISSKDELGDPTRLSRGDILPWVIQRHLAERAGPHYDVRFGTGPDADKMYSFATKKELPEPGGKIKLFQQPLHDLGYKDFEGEIPKGYGKGVVKKHDEGEVVILSAKPGHIIFATGSERFPRRFALIKDKKDPKHWLLSNVTPSGTIPYKKMHYKKVPTENVEEIMPPEYTITPKIDGAAALYRILKNRVEAYSYRTSKSGKPIIHTERLGIPVDKKLPKKYEDTILRGEIYGTADGKAIPAQQLGGVLNSALAKSLRKQRENDITMKNMLFGVRQFSGDPVPEDTPYSEQRDMLKEILPYMPKGFHLPQEARTRAAARKMINRIEKGDSPLTVEGIVAHPKGGGKPAKAKFVDDYDVYINSIFPGKKRLAGTGAGGFTYSLEPEGPAVGRVGTGFSDEVRRDMLEHPEKYRNRVAKIQAQGQFPSGAYRAPAFHALHEDK